MSNLNLLESELSILEAVEGLNRDVYEIEVPEDSALKYDKFGSLAAPFYVLTFNGLLGPEYGDRSLCGAASDPVRNILSAQTYAGDTMSLRTAHAELVGLLTGFYPVGSGELRFGGGNGFSMASNTVRPTLYARVAFYTYTTNMISGN